MLKDITEVISSDSFNIKSLNIESNDGIFEGRILVYVHNVESLNKLSKRISSIQGVERVNRIQDMY